MIFIKYYVFKTLQAQFILFHRYFLKKYVFHLNVGFTVLIFLKKW